MKVIAELTQRFMNTSQLNPTSTTPIEQDNSFGKVCNLSQKPSWSNQGKQLEPNQIFLNLLES